MRGNEKRFLIRDVASLERIQKDSFLKSKSHSADDAMQLHMLEGNEKLVWRINIGQFYLFDSFRVAQIEEGSPISQLQSTESVQLVNEEYS